jgi:hypothetical protein
LRIFRSFSGGGGVLAGLSSLNIPVLWETFQSLVLVILVTVAVWLALRTLLKPVYRRMGERAKHANFLRTVFIFVGTTVLDAAVVIGSWALGYSITLLALGDYAQVGFRQALYLNAFLLVELVKVAIRAIISPTTGGLRLVHLSNNAAIRLNRHVNVVVSILGYGLLLVVPLINRNVSFVAGLGVSALISTFVLVYLVVLVIRHRSNVANWIAYRLTAKSTDDDLNEAVGQPASILAAQETGQTSTEGPTALETHKQMSGILGTLIRTWHWFTLAYLGFMVLVVISRPADVVAAYLLASGKVLAAALIGSLIVGAIGRGVRHGVVLPEELQQKLPL